MKTSRFDSCARLRLMLFLFGALSLASCKRDLPTRSDVPTSIPLGGQFDHVISQLAETTGIRLISILPGTFVMGSPPSEANHLESESPQTTVTISAMFFLAATPITQSEYSRVLGQLPHGASNMKPNAPVYGVTWGDAMSFCKRLSELDGVSGSIPSGYHFSLPTEAQWEYACRAGTSSPYAGDLDATSWYSSNAGGTIHPVATKSPNAFGLYDMQGNVVQWCYDWFAKYPGGNVLDPIGPSQGKYRVIRGSNIFSEKKFCRSAARSFSEPDFVNPSPTSQVGFRIALRREP